MHTRTALPFARLGEYELVRLLATGGMSEVYEARRERVHRFQKRFALKRILPQLSADERLLKMFCDEARVHAALSHPNLVQVVDFGEAGGEPYLVMEFVDGPTLSKVNSALRGRKRTMPLPHALYVARQVLEGLDYAHQALDPTTGLPLHIVHRDVAPSNILFGNAGEVKLADFGIVSSVINELVSAPNEIKGKLGYLSPEQAMGRRVDARSDVFSAGVVLAESLLGTPLFAGRTTLEVLESLYSGDLRVLDERGAHLPADVHALLRRALAQDIGLRHQSARDFADQLDEVIRRHSFEMSANRLVDWLIELGVVSLRSDIRAMTTARPVAPTFRPRSKPPVAERAAEATPSELERAIVQSAEGALEYRVRRPGGTIVGPLRLARLLEMITTARAGIDTQVARGSGPFMPLASVYELARLAARPAYRFFDPVALLASERFSLDRSTLPARAYEMCFAGRTGLLAITAGCERFRCFFTQGALSATASTEPSELLGNCLVQTGQLEPSRLDDLLEQGFRRGLRLGEALCDSGVIGNEALTRTLSNQRARRLAGIFGWTSGDVVFVDGAPAGEEEAERATPRVLTTAVRAAYDDDEVRGLLSPLHAAALAPSPNFAERLPLLGLDAAEAETMHSAARGGRLDRIAVGARTRNVAPFRALFIGLSAGLLTAEGRSL